jgi:hypothetical protein
MSRVVKSKDVDKARINVVAICRDCKHYHDIDLHPDLFGRAAFDWEHKHQGHEIEFLSPRRFIPGGFDDKPYEQAGRAPWWLEWRENSDIKIAYTADAAFTLDLTGLAASATWVAGRESTRVDNTSNKYLDYKISGSYISGTSPTSGEARLYYVQPQEDTPTWPDVFDGTDSNETVTNTSILDKLPLGWSGGNSTTTNVTYPIISALTLAQAFGIVPHHFLVFFTHSMVAALKTDAANTNGIFYKGCYATST